ncbi:hypothetical protein B1813_16865 [Saccharomonospora piscinae]|uniref:TNT domain-containing protein n=1 Tax=Saccharomonospora piscinae TaxID=687388 RepID=A0A1V9A292_SACPI|nr:hypothetical protein B1813_16865 [Saccharomonospora piscinae]
MDVALPTQLNATEQDTLVKQIGLALLRAAPRDWRRVTVEYRAVGRYHELTGDVATADGTTQEWIATHDIAGLFGRLRTGMYREGRGTWFNARYQLDHPSSYNLEYDREEPQWDLAPPPQAYADELRMFPRNEENVPDWLMRRMAGLGPERPGPRFRMARVFDGAGAGGRPVVNRPELDVEEQDRLLDYLDGAPVVMPGRGYDLDRLSNSTESTVPIAFHSDGTWIWPAAVNYYLRQYGVAPEPELVQHVRANGFAIPDVPDPVRQAAAAHVSRGAPPQQPPPAQQPPQPPQPTQRPASPATEQGGAEHAEHAEHVEAAAEPEHAESDAERTRIAAPLPTVPQDHDDERVGGAPVEESDAERTRIAMPPHVAPDEPGPADERAEAAYREPGYDDYDGYDTVERPDVPADAATTYTPAAMLDDGPPTTITPPQPPPEREQDYREYREPDYEDHEYEDEYEDYAGYEDREPGGGDIEDVEDVEDEGPPTQYSAAPLVFDEPVLDDLQDRLEELGVPGSAYRLGEPNDHGWALEEVGEGWRVGWYDDKQLTSPAVFGDVEDAAAFMLGKVLLAPEGAGAHPAAPGPEGSAAGAAGALGTPPRTPAPPPERPAPPPRVTTTLSSDVATGARPPEPQDQPRPPAPSREEPLPRRPQQGGPPPSAPAPVAPGSPPPAPPAPPTPPRREAPRTAEPAAGANGAAAPPGGQGGKGNQQWPIQPMQGEPPLTLFRGKEMRDLPVGSELDRFGGPNGNLTYAAGTPFEERSLVPEWVNRSYHVYRVQRPVRALAGVAIPWFNQPGGGAAYLLPASVEDLLADGDLIELDPGEPPVD